MDAYDNVMNNNKIWDSFVACGELEENDNLDDEDLHWLFSYLVGKTFNARAGVEVVKFKQENTSRYSKKATGDGLRVRLKQVAKREGSD